MESGSATAPSMPSPVPSTRCSISPIQMRGRAFWISRPARSRNDASLRCGGEIGVPHVRDTFPGTVRLLLPYLEGFALVGRGFAVGIRKGHSITPLGIRQVARASHFDL